MQRKAIYLTYASKKGKFLLFYAHLHYHCAVLSDVFKLFIEIPHHITRHHLLFSTQRIITS